MSFPQELKSRKQWVCWRLEPDKDGGKPKKMPINPITGKGAMSNNPNTWTDFKTAVGAYEQYVYTGIGYMFTKDDGYVGVDIDHCYNPETNEFNNIAKAIIAKQPTYAEFSPSGDGIHLYFKGVKPKGSSKSTENGVEMYESARYFTVTGKKLDGALDTVAEGTDTLAWIHETYIKKARMKKSKKKKSAAVTIELTMDLLRILKLNIKLSLQIKKVCANTAIRFLNSLSVAERENIVLSSVEESGKRYIIKSISIYVIIAV